MIKREYGRKENRKLKQDLVRKIEGESVRESHVRRLLSSRQHMATDSAPSPGANPSPQEQESSDRGWQSASYCQMAQNTHLHKLKQTIKAY